MDRRKLVKWIALISGSLLLLLILTVIAFELTSTPGFCANCHEISPMVASWQQSSHKNVSCFKCHAEPGWTGYVKRKVGGLREVYLHVTNQAPKSLSVRLDQQNCISCHNGSQNYPGAKNVYDLGLRGKTNFVHQIHLGLNQTCMDCHRAVVHGTSPQDPATNSLKINYHPICSKCHQVKPPTATVDDANSWEFGPSCGKCHPADPRNR